MVAVGAMTMPVGFKYSKTFQLGRPRHEKYSDFWRKHIPMDPGHRAKIFSPFDALAGFDEAIASKQIQYVDRKLQNKQDLNKKLTYLSDCFCPVTVSYFVPCSDVNNAAYENGQGTYESITGVIENIDYVTETLRIADQEISFDDIDNVYFDW